jgi:hypothetical protein
MEGEFRIGKRKAAEVGSEQLKSGLSGYRRTEQQRIHVYFRHEVDGESAISRPKSGRMYDSSQNRKTFMFF